MNFKTARIGTVATFVVVFGLFGYRGKLEAVRLAQRDRGAAAELAAIEAKEIELKGTAAGHNNQAIVYAQKGETAAAIAEFSKAIGARKQLGEGEGQRELADTYKNRGIVFLRDKTYPNALKDFTDGIEILQKLVDTKGSDEGVAIELASSLKRRSSALRDHGKPDEAIEDLSGAIALLQRVIEQRWEVDIAAELADSYTERAALYRGGTS